MFAQSDSRTEARSSGQPAPSIRFQPRVETLEDRLVPSWPAEQQIPFYAGQSYSGLVATVNEPDGDFDPGFSGQVVYQSRAGTVQTSAQVSQRSDGRLNVFASFSNLKAGLQTLTIHITEVEEDGTTEQVTATTTIYASSTLQGSYGVAPAWMRAKLRHGGEHAWKIEAHGLIDQIQAFLPPGETFRVTSIVKAGEHARNKKIDVVPTGLTTWEDLAYAASQAGFWVHAEKVWLDGVFWPRSPHATGSHLDLYLKK